MCCTVRSINELWMRGIDPPIIKTWYSMKRFQDTFRFLIQLGTNSYLLAECASVLYLLSRSWVELQRRFSKLWQVEWKWSSKVFRNFTIVYKRTSSMKSKLSTICHMNVDSFVTCDKKTFRRSFLESFQTPEGATILELLKGEKLR